MKIEYTKDIEEIFRVPNKFPHPEDKETLLRFQDRIEDEKAFDMIQVTAPVNKKFTYDVISKYPAIRKDHPFIGSSHFFYCAGKRTDDRDYPLDPSNARFAVKNIFSEKTKRHFKEKFMTGKNPEIFIFMMLQMLYGSKFIIESLEKKYNIYEDVAEKLDPILLLMNELLCNEKEFFNTHKEWLLKLSRNVPNAILGLELNLKELIRLYMISSRCDNYGFDGLNLEVVHSNDDFYGNMSGVDLVVKRERDHFIVTQIVYNTKKDSVKEFNELDYFFPLFNRSEIVCKKNGEKEVLKRTLGSFFLESCYFEDEDTIKEIIGDKFFINHALSSGKFESIVFTPKTKASKIINAIEENKFLSHKEKSILNQLFFLVSKEAMNIFKSMGLSPKTITSEDFFLFQMQFKNNEPIKLEKMFDNSLMLLDKMEAGSINIKDMKFDNEEWDKKKI